MSASPSTRSSGLEGRGCCAPSVSSRRSTTSTKATRRSLRSSWCSQQLEEGVDTEEAWHRVRSSLVFTTHTPVAAGNETYAGPTSRANPRPDHRPDRRPGTGPGHGAHRAQRLQRSLGVCPPWRCAPAGLRTASAAATAGGAGDVAGCSPGRAVDDIPITHVTNGVHVPTWLRQPIRELLDEHLGAGWLERADDPTTWAPISDIPDEDLWRRGATPGVDLIEHVRVRATQRSAPPRRRHRLRRGGRSTASIPRP